MDYGVCACMYYDSLAAKNGLSSQSSGDEIRAQKHPCSEENMPINDETRTTSHLSLQPVTSIHLLQHVETTSF